MALREIQVRIDVQVPEPNTWHETLAALDQKLPVAGLRVAVQEYGKPIPELVEGLEQRGATVTRVAVYRWALPADLAPLHTAIDEIAAGRVGAALFTSAQQVEHLLMIAAERGREAALGQALKLDTLVASVGPTTSETLRHHGLPVEHRARAPQARPPDCRFGRGLAHLGEDRATSGCRGAGGRLRTALTAYQPEAPARGQRSARFPGTLAGAF